MGRGRGKGRKHTVNVIREDHRSGEEEKVPAHRRRGRPLKPLKPLKDDIEEVEKIDEDLEFVKGSISSNNMENQTVMENGRKRKRLVQVKESADSAKEENEVGTKLCKEDTGKTVGFRQIGSRRKNKPRRAAEVGVECN